MDSGGWEDRGRPVRKAGQRGMGMGMQGRPEAGRKAAASGAGSRAEGKGTQRPAGDGAKRP